MCIVISRNSYRHVRCEERPDDVNSSTIRRPRWLMKPPAYHSALMLRGWKCGNDLWPSRPDEQAMYWHVDPALGDLAVSR